MLHWYLWRAVSAGVCPDLVAGAVLAVCRPWRLRLAFAVALHVGGLRLAFPKIDIYDINFSCFGVCAVSVICHFFALLSAAGGCSRGGSGYISKIICIASLISSAALLVCCSASGCSASALHLVNTVCFMPLYSS